MVPVMPLDNPGILIRRRASYLFLPCRGRQLDVLDAEHLLVVASVLFVWYNPLSNWGLALRILEEQGACMLLPIREWLLELVNNFLSSSHSRWSNIKRCILLLYLMTIHELRVLSDMKTACVWRCVLSDWYRTVVHVVSICLVGNHPIA